MGEDFPFVCDRCLGDNPYLRMIKLPNYDACKITKKPFTVFKWRPSRKNGVFNRTIVSYEIAAEKNICQACLNDLTYGVPVALRDQFVKSQNNLASQRLSDVPTSEINQAYYFQQKLANKDNKLFLGNGIKEEKNASDHLLDLAKEFKQRQDEVHENDDDELKKERRENLSGSRKTTRKGTPTKNLLDKAPEDETLSTLFLSNLPDTCSEDEIKALLNTYGIIVRIYMLVEKHSCFVEFSTRDEAERAVFNINNRVMFKGKRVKVSWAHGHDRYHERGQQKQELADMLLKQKDEEHAGQVEQVAKKRKLDKMTPASEWKLFTDEQLRQGGVDPSTIYAEKKYTIEFSRLPEILKLSKIKLRHLIVSEDTYAINKAVLNTNSITFNMDDILNSLEMEAELNEE